MPALRTEAELYLFFTFSLPKFRFTPVKVRFWGAEGTKVNQSEPEIEFLRLTPPAQHERVLRKDVSGRNRPASAQTVHAKEPLSPGTRISSTSSQEDFRMRIPC